MIDLTPKQSLLLRFIVDEQQARRAPPSFREMCDHMRVSSNNAIFDLVEVLIAKGMLARSGPPSASRNLRPTPLGMRTMGVLMDDLPMLYATIADLQDRAADQDARIAKLEERIARLMAVEEG